MEFLKDEILQSLAEGFLKEENTPLAGNKVFIESINVLAKPVFGNEITIKMLSPVTVYSTLNKSDGAKKTYYYSPLESEFSMLLKENLRKKYEAAFGENAGKFDFEMMPYKVRPSDEKVILYQKVNTKPTVIKAWMGIYKMKAAPRIMELSYDTGLGAKNSQGFGCWDIYSRCG